MLEVCFGDSAKGTLAVAQHCGASTLGGAVAFLTTRRGLSCFFRKRKARKDYEKRQRELQKIAVPLGGNLEDVVNVSLHLSEGDIQSSAPFADFSKLESNPDKIRVWLDDTPDARCGILYLADLLQTSGTEIHVVELPEKVERGDHVVVHYRGWAEVEPQLWGTFLDRERVLSADEVRNFASQWQALQAENAPLRVVKNGDVFSAPITYYDDRIRGEFPKDSCKIANIIGNAIGRQNIPTGDVFIADRIQRFIADGELVVLEPNEEQFYGTIVAPRN